MLKAATILVALASLVGSALAQSTPSEPHVTGDENEPYYPAYIYPAPLCAGGRSLIGAPSAADGAAAAWAVSREQDATVLTFNKDDQTWEEALGFRYDSSHAMEAFTYRSADDAPTHSIVARVHGVTEFRDANANGVMDSADLVLQEFLVADDANLLAAMPQEHGEPAMPGEPLASSSSGSSEPAATQQGSQATDQHDAQSPYLLHMARDWRSPCAVQFKWTYFLTLGLDGFQDRIEKRDASVFADEPRLSLQFTHVGAPFDADGVALVPERVKIDIGIEDFPYSAPDSLLGVRVTILSQDPLQKDAAGVSGEAGDARVGFTWATTALVDGQVQKVGAFAEPTNVPEWHLDSWTKEARSAMLVTFAYPHASSILHDPEVGKLEAQGALPPVPGVAKVPAAGWLALVAVVGALALARARR